STPARITEPTVGASVCASGSHVCSGHSGLFTAKATARRVNAASCVPAGRARPAPAESATRSAVPAPGPTTDTPTTRDTHPDQQEHRAEQGVQHELAGRPPPVRPAPAGDHRVHRQQYDLEEHEEQHEIEGEEHADDADLDHQQERDELPATARVAPERVPA